MRFTSVLNSIMAFLFIMITLNGCSTTSEVTSRWRGQDIVWDSSGNDWQDTPQYYDKDKHISVRIMNDDEFLYLYISSGDMGLTRKLIMNGFTVWLDAEGDRKKTVGIRIQSISKAKPDEQNVNMPVGSEIIHYDNEIPIKTDIAKAGETGILISADQSGGRVIYKFRIKIKGELSIPAPEPGKFLGIGIESGKTDKAENMKKDRSGGDDSPAGHGGGMGSMKGGGGHGGGRASHSRQMIEPFEVWLKVSMSSKH